MYIMAIIDECMKKLTLKISSSLCCPVPRVYVYDNIRMNTRVVLRKIFLNFLWSNPLKGSIWIKKNNPSKIFFKNFNI